MCNLTPAYPDPMESDQAPAEWQEPEIYSVKLQRCIRACIAADPVFRPRARELSLLAYDEIKGAPQIKAALNDVALLQAAGAGDFDSAMELVQQGADPKARDLHTHETAFHFVVKSDCPALIPLLVGHNMLNEKNGQGDTPLHCAAVSGSGAMTSALLNQGADRLKMDNDKLLPMQRAAKAGNDEALRELLDQSADEIDLSYHNTALRLAVESGSDSCVRLLIDRGADIDAEQSNGETAFYLAAGKGHLAVLQALAQAKCYKDKPVEGLTALLRACDNGQFEVSEKLIELGCDAHALSSEGLTSLHLAARKGHSRVLNLLINVHVDLEARSNIEGQEGWTALHMAVSKPDLLVTQVLIEAGSCLEARNMNGNTALHEAIIAKQFEMMKLLLAQGSDVNAKGVAGVTAMHLSTALGDVELVQVLLEHEAKIDTTTKDGLTPLSIAAWCGRFMVVRVLIEHGAKTGARDIHGHSALELARAGNHEDIVELLIKSGASDNKSLIHRTSDTLKYFLTFFV
ncbi:hypothetical protein ABVK25_007370 [Lepraria finkii]|uniref:Uncharacterized protein n=1 Tax=Lepraria finkii TaxID=1340010 RepID=A0ABR4B3N1_9LECA